MNIQSVNEMKNIDNQGNSVLVTPDLTKVLENNIEPIMVQRYREGRTFLAIGARQGKRLLLQINVHATEIPTLLRSTNRLIDYKHVKNIKNYIKQREKSGNKWILGTITANIAPEPSKIKYQKIWDDLYLIFVLNNVSIEISDGQHRKQAIEELLNEDRDLLGNATFPVSLVLEGDINQCFIDFRDMAQTLSIPNSLLVAYGQYGTDGIAGKVVEQVNLFRNKTQKIKATTGSRTGYIYTLNYIAKLVSCAFTGQPKNKLSQINTTDLVEERARELSDCLNYFFEIYTQMLKDFEENNNKKLGNLMADILKQEKLYWKIATEFRETCILGVSVGLEILGTLLFYTLDQETNRFDRTKVKQLAEKIDWSKRGKFWKDTLVFYDKQGGIKMKTNRDSVVSVTKLCLERIQIVNNYYL